MRFESKRRTGFTLVELLVVIGVIALLVSMLLPALGKARAQANLVVCQSNLRSIGQLLNIYASEHRGYLPYGYGNAQGGLQLWSWPGPLSLLSAGKTAQYASIQVAANGYYPPVSQSNVPVDYAQVFHDVDVPEVAFAPLAGCYNGNARLLPDATRVDPLTGPNIAAAGAQYYHPRSLGSILRASQTMLIWDGSLIIWNGKITGTGNYVDGSIDGSQANANGWGHCMAFPSPWMTPAQYGTPIAPGNLSANSNWVNSVTKAVQISQNRDDVTNQYSNIYGLRYRHMINKVANTLYVDGHVESKHIGEILARDICVNP